MKLLGRLSDYATHPDPLTAACNRIALIVAWNQPIYPLYLWWLVGGGWWVGCWTFLSTPFFAGVPIVARRNPLAGRLLLPLTGIANGMLSAKAFGVASGVELFLIPCALIALLAFHRNEWRMIVVLLGATLCGSLAHGHYGAPSYHFEPSQYAHFENLNAWSAAALSIVILWSLIRARASSAQPRSRS